MDELELQKRLGAKRRERRRQVDDPDSPTLGMHRSWQTNQKHTWGCYFV